MSEQYRVIEGAQVAPLLRDARRPHRLISTFSLRDASGHAVRGWPLLTSLDTSFPLNRPMRAAAEGHMPVAIYGGFFSPVFGHFLTESLPDLAAVAALARENPDVPVLCHIGPRMGPDPLRPLSQEGFMGFFLDRLGLEFARLRFVTEPMTVGSLLMAPAPFRRKERYQPWSAALLDRYFALPDASGPLKIYFSRSRWPKPRLADEAEIEALLQAEGYEIIHPQELDLEAQLQLVCGARSLVGPQGTALHWSLFSSGLRQVISLGWRSNLQRGICEMRGQAYKELRGQRPKGAELRVRAISQTRLSALLQV